jgi:hypothetical protein
LARDAGMVLLLLWLLVRPRTALSLDGWLRADPGSAGTPQPSRRSVSQASGQMNVR